MAIVVSAAALSNASLAIAGSVYKWTDENGVIHYSDKEPSKGATKLKVGTTASKPGNQNSQAGDGNEDAYTVKPELQSQIDELEKKQQVDEVQAKIDAETAEEMNKNQERCKSLRSNMQTIEENARIQVEEEGERRYLTAEEIVEKRQKIATDIKENCGG
ncbi:hypothetical protein GCM10022278_30480 [Allohahella marinimesophila]|uniref:DUF4124 domain-containing protein n=2 Tax=Allohahella marinimesophila TaxID=1054972 RepID=A0ABP7PTQ3_9GAMM